MHKSSYTLGISTGDNKLKGVNGYNEQETEVSGEKKKEIQEICASFYFLCCISLSWQFYL